MTTPTPTPTPAAWMFVSEHAAILNAAAWKHCPPQVEIADMRQELALEVARRHHAYDADRAKPSTWIYWQARAVAQRLRRSDRKVNLAKAEIIDLQHAANGGHRADSPGDDLGRQWEARRTADRRAQVALAVRDASSIELEAMDTVVAGLTRRETRERLGVSHQARNGRLRRLGERLLRHG